MLRPNGVPDAQRHCGDRGRWRWCVRAGAVGGHGKRRAPGDAAHRSGTESCITLSTLLDEHDFTASSLLLNVLGEGTFLDLLRFIETHAPDAATAAAARLAHRDERRHVHFGISNIKRSVSIDRDVVGRLVTAAETRAAKLVSLSGLSPVLQEALTIMAARSLQPAYLSDAAADVRALMQTMERNRLRRLQACGFDTATARHLSDLHTLNLM